MRSATGKMVRGRIRRAGKAIRSWHGTVGSPLNAKARETPGLARYNFLSFETAGLRLDQSIDEFYITLADAPSKQQAAIRKGMLGW